MTRESALASAGEVAAYLKQVHGATRVLLFGSVVEGQFLPEHSDIDLYFEGVPEKDEGFVAGQTLLDFCELDLDLIPAGLAPATLKVEIMKTGLPL